MDLDNFLFFVKLIQMMTNIYFSSSPEFLRCVFVNCSDDLHGTETLWTRRADTVQDLLFSFHSVLDIILNLGDGILDDWSMARIYHRRRQLQDLVQGSIM